MAFGEALQKKKKNDKVRLCREKFLNHFIEALNREIRITAIQGTKTILLFNKSTPPIVIMLRNKPFPVDWLEIETLSKFPEFNS